MKEKGDEIFDWIRSGAYIYVCGQKAPMSVDVENELLSILEVHGELTKENAKKYFEQMKRKADILKMCIKNVGFYLGANFTQNAKEQRRKENYYVR
jgi:hypothetical protein